MFMLVQKTSWKTHLEVKWKIKKQFSGEKNIKNPNKLTQLYLEQIEHV